MEQQCVLKLFSSFKFGYNFRDYLCSFKYSFYFAGKKIYFLFLSQIVVTVVVTSGVNSLISLIGFITN